MRLLFCFFVLYHTFPANATDISKKACQTARFYLWDHRKDLTFGASAQKL